MENKQEQEHPELNLVSDGIADRLYKLLVAILNDGTAIPKTYHQIILNMVKPYLKKTSNSELATWILEMRDKVIPFILYGNKD